MTVKAAESTTVAMPTFGPSWTLFPDVEGPSSSSVKEASYDITVSPDDPKFVMPPIVEFVESPLFLDRPPLYPPQKTILKLAFLEMESITDYDREVIADWSKHLSEE